MKKSKKILLFWCSKIKKLMKTKNIALVVQIQKKLFVFKKFFKLIELFNIQHLLIDTKLFFFNNFMFRHVIVKTDINIISNNMYFMMIFPFSFIIWYFIWFSINKFGTIDSIIEGKAQTMLTNHLDRCYEKVDPNYKIKDGHVCYDHFSNEKELKCHLDIIPDDNREYVLVLGASHPAARIFTNILKTKKILYREIKSRISFDVEEEYNRELILYTIEFKCIIDFSHSNSSSLLTNFASDRGIPLFHIVSQYQNEKGVYELLIPPVFGPVYFDVNTLSFFRQVVSKLEGKNEKYDYEPLDDFASASEIADYLYETIFSGSYIPPGKLPRKFKTYLAQDILDMIDKKKEMVESIQSDIYYIKTMRKEPDVPYVSLSIVVSNDKEIIERVKVVMKLYEMVLPLYPEASFELIYLFIHTQNDDKTFWDIFSPGNLMKKHIKVYEMPHNEYIKLLPIMNTTKIPDYFIRNIGFRLSQGEYIFSGSGDSLPTPFFFDSAERKLFNPMSTYRSHRVDYNGTQDDDDVYFHYSEKHKLLQYDIMLADWKTPWHKSMWYVYTWGDFQGGHRKMVESIQGYINDKWVYHVDNVFALDMSTFKAAGLVLTLPTSFHVCHKLVSQNTEEFPLFKVPDYMNAFCRGQRSTTFPNLQRPLWGLQYNSSRGTLNVTIENNIIGFISV